MRESEASKWCSCKLILYVGLELVGNWNFVIEFVKVCWSWLEFVRIETELVRDWKLCFGFLMVELDWMVSYVGFFCIAALLMWIVGLIVCHYCVKLGCVVAMWCECCIGWLAASCYCLLIILLRWCIELMAARLILLCCDMLLMCIVVTDLLCCLHWMLAILLSVVGCLV